MFAAANVGIEIGKAYYDPYAALYTGDRPSRFAESLLLVFLYLL